MSGETLLAAPPPTQRTPAAPFLTEVQALRAVAVTAVVLYHLWPARLPGGFVGVDVFFVISGFLITSHLLREVTRTGRIDLARFWARRAKRLLPASLLVLAGSTLATVALVPAAHWPQFLREVIGSAMYAQNWVLAADSVDYLAADNLASPVQHFWTLSVEEQFYLALPVLMVLTLAAARRRRSNPRRLMFAALVVIVAASLLLSVALTAANPAVAYFSTATRAWEFGAGALLAFATVRPPRAIRTPLAWLGLAMIAAGCVAYSEHTPFPGVAAVVPVAGTLAVIWAGAAPGRFTVDRVGRVGAVRFVGHVSYSMYLWHWPLIVLLPFALARPLGTLDRVLVLVVTVALAWLSTRFVEEPVRFSPRLLGRERRPRTVAVWSATGMLLVVALAGSALAGQVWQRAAAEQLTRDILAADPACLGAKATDPSAIPCHNPDLEDVLIPAPTQIRGDDGNREECWGPGADALKFCTLGSPDGPGVRVLAVGDSHNNALIPAYERAARELGWRIDVAGTGGCYWTAADLITDIAEHSRACADWRESVHRHLDSGPPYDAILVTGLTVSSTVEPAAGRTVEQELVDGLTAVWAPQIARGTRVIAIRDVPHITAEVAACVERLGADAENACTLPRPEAFRDFDAFPEAVARTDGARLVDLSEHFCTETECRSVIGHVRAYRDTHHVSATFAATLGPYLADELKAALAE